METEIRVVKLGDKFGVEIASMNGDEELVAERLDTMEEAYDRADSIVGHLLTTGRRAFLNDWEIHKFNEDMTDYFGVTTGRTTIGYYGE